MFLLLCLVAQVFRLPVGQQSYQDVTVGYQLLSVCVRRGLEHLLLMLSGLHGRFETGGGRGGSCSSNQVFEGLPRRVGDQHKRHERPHRILRLFRSIRPRDDKPAEVLRVRFVGRRRVRDDDDTFGAGEGCMVRFERKGAVSAVEEEDVWRLLQLVG